MTTSYAPGQQIPVVYQDNYTVQVEGDLTNVDCWVGVAYTQKFTFSKQYLKKQGSNVSELEGRLQHKRWKLVHKGTHSYRVEVTPKFRNTYTKEFNGDTVGNSPVQLSDGEFSFLVPAKNDEVEVTVINEGPFAANFIAAEWQADYSSKARHV